MKGILILFCTLHKHTNYTINFLNVGEEVFINEFISSKVDAKRTFDMVFCICAGLDI